MEWLPGPARGSARSAIPCWSPWVPWLPPAVVKASRSASDRAACRTGRAAAGPCLSAGERRQVAQPTDAGQEEVGAASQGGEGRQADDLPLDRPLRDREVEAAILGADKRIAL